MYCIVYLESLNVVDLTNRLHRTLGRSIMLWRQAAWNHSRMLLGNSYIIISCEQSHQRLNYLDKCDKIKKKLYLYNLSQYIGGGWMEVKTLNILKPH